MFKKIKEFWENFWSAFKSAYNVALKGGEGERTQDYRDTHHINFLAIFVSKLNNLANTEATFDIRSDSALTDDIQVLCKDLEAKRFDVLGETLATGNYYVFFARDNSGRPYHRYVQGENVCILAMDGEQITDLLGIIDTYVDNNNRTYFLNRRHTLNNQVLTVEIYTTDSQARRVVFDEWADLEVAYEIHGADNIGVGCFKSPISSRGKDPVYGVPLNFGCEEIERKCINDLKLIETEFERAESKIFTDPLILKKGRNDAGADAWKIPEGIFPINRRAGESGPFIEIFSPEIRYSAYYSKLVNDMAQYEQQVGTDKGFLTPFESVVATTATEIRRANASTIALIDKIHAAMKKGIEETLKSDAMFLGVPDELYTLEISWFDPFADEAEQYQRLANAVDRGIAEKKDELQWLFPNLTAEELDEKLARIEEAKATETNAAIEKMLNEEA